VSSSACSSPRRPSREALQAGLIKAFDIDAACQFHGDKDGRWGKFAAISGDRPPRPRADPLLLGC